MRILILLASLIVLTPTTALADYFQFFDGATPYYIPNAKILFNGNAIGYTDAYGRVRIDLAPGNYQVQIEFRDGLRTVLLHVDGSAQLKKIEAH